MKKLPIILLLLFLSCSRQGGDATQPPSSVDEFKELISNIVKDSDENAFYSLLYNNQIPLDKKSVLMLFNKSKPVEITVVKYYPNSIQPQKTPMGYPVFTKYPDYYCLIEQKIGVPPNQGVVSLELGLCKLERGIHICGKKFIDKWTPRETDTAFFLIAPDGIGDQFKKTNGNWSWGTSLNGFECRNFSFDDLAKFLGENLKIKIKNKIDIDGTYTFLAPIGKGNSISRVIAGLENIGLKLTEQ